MASKHKLRIKRLKRRDRARARDRAAQPIATQPALVRSNGTDIFKSLEKRFDELLGPRTPAEMLINVLVSKP
jgi:hypothetical protein